MLYLTSIEGDSALNKAEHIAHVRIAISGTIRSEQMRSEIELAGLLHDVPGEGPNLGIVCDTVTITGSDHSVVTGIHEIETIQGDLLIRVELEINRGAVILVDRDLTRY